MRSFWENIFNLFLISFKFVLCLVKMYMLVGTVFKIAFNFPGKQVKQRKEKSKRKLSRKVPSNIMPKNLQIKV